MDLVKDIYHREEEKMKKSLEAVSHELASIRTGKATTALLDAIRVEYYGSLVPLNQVGTVSAPEPRLLTIQPWEKTVIPNIVKAIQKSELGLNPQSDGNIIRLPIPPLTEERRKDLVKLVHKLAEEGKVAIRNVRRDAIENVKKVEKEKKISEDDSKKAQKHIQEITDKFIELVDKMIAGKEKEIMEV
ncbi:MAG TPA: ribosome recycling factor [candidate division Zixibacteria bacterium]|nr:ribosome recycling factor [candidate division Zixibacteria bacterium]